MRGRKRLRKKVAKANAVLAWDKAMMRFTIRHFRPATLFFGAQRTPGASHILHAIFDDIEEEKPNDSSAFA